MRSAHPDARQSPEQMGGTGELSRENKRLAQKQCQPLCMSYGAVFNMCIDMLQ